VITPETVGNVTIPELCGDWLFAQVGASDGRHFNGKAVLAKTQEEFESSVLAVMRRQNLNPDSVFGFEPCEVTIVSFPQWLAVEAAEKTDIFLKQLVFDAVARQAFDYKCEFEMLPEGFQRTPSETETCFRVCDPARLGKLWFIGTEEEFLVKFSKQFEWYGRKGAASVAPQPSGAEFFGVFSGFNEAEQPISTTLEIRYDSESDISPISGNVEFYFQKRCDRPDLTRMLFDIRVAEYEKQLEKSRLYYAERNESRRLTQQTSLSKFFGKD
jgi:hypothetical protein